MTQQEKQNACIQICKYACVRVYNDTYEPTNKNIINKINKLVDDIENHLHIPYSGDRTSIVEVTTFILNNAWSLQQALRKQERDLEMDLYNADVVDVIDIY